MRPERVGSTGNHDDASPRAVETQAISVRLTPVPKVQEVEESIARSFMRRGSLARALLVDMRECRKFDVAILLYLVALTSHRTKSGWVTRFRLPTTRTARAFLRAWSFPAAITRATNIPFRKLVDPPDLIYFGQSAMPAPRAQNHDATAALLSYLIETKFFSFRAYRLDDTADSTDMMQQEWDRWRGPLVMSLMKHNLSDGPAADIARVVIYELLANAIEHPNAKLLFLVSCMGHPNITPWPSDDALTIAIWDDGRAIHHTLRECLEQGGPIRAAAPPVRDTFTVTARGWVPANKSYDSTWTPTASAEDAELLLASLFPGISEKLALPIPYIKQPENFAYMPEMGHVGNGLHALYRTVVGAFGGSIEFRADGLRMKITKRSGAHTAYAAALTVTRNRAAPSGNMVTVRIPVKK